MRILFDTKTLQEAVDKAAGFISGKLYHPEFTRYMLLSVSDDRLIRLQAGGGEQGMFIVCGCDVQITGAPVALPGKRFHNIVKLLPGNNVTIAEDEGGVTIKSGDFAAKLNTLDASMLPEFPTTDVTPVAVETEAFFDALRKVVSFVSTEETRAFLSGVYFDADHEGTLVATDGKALAVSRVDISYIGNGIIVPTEAIARILSLFASESEIKIAVDEERLLVGGDGVRMYTSLIAGEYPDYNMILEPARKGDIQVECSSADLLDALRRVTIITTFGKISCVRVTCSPDAIVLKTEEVATGEAVETLSNVKCSGNVEFGVNGDFFIKALKSAGGDTVKLLMKDSLAPVHISAVDDDSFEAVVMPIRLDKQTEERK